MSGPATVTRAAADIGGTFTDVAVLAPDGRLATRKLPSTPANYADAVIAGVRSLLEELGSPPGALEELLHGCTVATNAILEGKGAPTALLTTRGFRDVLELRRVRVPELYEPLYERPPPLVPRQLRFEVGERTGPRGEVLLHPLDEAGRAGGGGAHPGRRDRGGRGLLPPLLREPGPRAADGRNPARDAPRRVRLPLGRRAAPEARVRTHLHHRHQRLRRVLRSSGTSARWSPRSRGRASEAGSW